MAGLNWYFQRLRMMSPQEWVHRMGEAATLQSLRIARWRYPDWGVPDASFPSHARFCVAPAAQLPELPWHTLPAGDAADDLLKGRLVALGCEWQWSEAPEVWHQAPDTGREWPRRFFNAIPYRGGAYGDIRIAWEPSRLQWLIGLALLARSAPAARAQHAATMLEQVLLSWVAANPPLIGIHYVSAMECALRLLAVCHAVDMARARLHRPAEVFAALATLVGSHASLIERRLSLYSSSGNHTIAECAGLIYAGVLFPELPGADHWKSRGLEVLDREIRRQILDDGGGVEQAFWYLRFITELGLLVTALLRHVGETPPAGLADRLPRARRFLRLMSAAAGELPAVGDADDGYALSPLLNLVDEPEAGDSPCMSFPDSGYSLRTAGAPATTVLFDHGPLGMPPACGHGHADGLGVQLWRAGREVLVDTGTYRYTGAWRRYFRSTAAHNTVCIDGADQAEQAGPFMWAAPFRCELVREQQEAGVYRALARHRAYVKRAGIVHWRGLVLRPCGSLVVWDCIQGRGSHHLALAWHIAVPVVGQGRRWELGAQIVLEIDGGEAVRCYQGTSATSLGWRACGYGRKEPICTIRVETSAPLPCEFLSQMYTPCSAIPRSLIEQDVETFRRWMS
jgi:hypothetical protein